jgi:phytoene synthase
MNLYDKTCFECSKLITLKYSTSFSMGIRAFDMKFRNPVYAIYGFVRLADEIVDTFHDHNKQQLISNFKQETFKAIDERISMNPVLHAFQLVVNQYGIDTELIDAFLGSMEMDLDQKNYTPESYKTYIFGSAEVIGLMCLKVFCGDGIQLYEKLVPGACSLGSAFQKVNFLRDMKADFENLGRTYFPAVDFENFTDQDKRLIEADIQKDFADGLAGIKQLPAGTRKGVYAAYLYYHELFKKISRTPAKVVQQKRIRVSNTYKMALYCNAILQQKLNMI